MCRIVVPSFAPKLRSTTISMLLAALPRTLTRPPIANLDPPPHPVDDDDDDNHGERNVENRQTPTPGSSPSHRYSSSNSIADCLLAMTNVPAEISLDRQHRHDRLDRILTIVSHAINCATPDCGRLACRRMKAMIAHHRRCGQIARCALCRRFVSLCAYHARECRKSAPDNCAFPYCRQIQRRIRQRLADNQRNNNSQNNNHSHNNHALASDSTQQ